MFRSAFPKVSIRAFKNVSGKCPCCERLKLMTKTIKRPADRLILRQYRMIHRNYFLGEKLLYYQRRQEAKDSNGAVWSFIVDGMSSHSTHLPIGGHTRDYNPPFKTHLQGCIAHVGNESTMYWSFPNLSTGASFMIGCLHMEIERCLKAKRKLPTKIYLQVG